MSMPVARLRFAPISAINFLGRAAGASDACGGGRVFEESFPCELRS